MARRLFSMKINLEMAGTLAGVLEYRAKKDAEEVRTRRLSGDSTVDGWVAALKRIRALQQALRDGLPDHLKGIVIITEDANAK